MEENKPAEESSPQGEISVNPTSPYLVPGAIMVAGLLIAGAVLYSNSLPKSGSLQKVAAVGQAPAVSGDLADNDPFLGDPSAPVTIVEFGDFQCPFCKRFFDTTEKEIIDAYVKTGKARFVYRDYPLTAIHEMAQKSAEASECANEQDKFWSYHDRLYERQDGLSVANFKKWAGELGLNQSQFDQCLDSGKYYNEVQKDADDGQKAGVSGTPATFVNGRMISGAVPFGQFQTIIEEELSK